VQGSRRIRARFCVKPALSGREAPNSSAPSSGRGGAGLRGHRRRTQKDGRAGARLAPLSRPCKARERAALLMEAVARAAVGLAGGVLLVVVVVHAA